MQYLSVLLPLFSSILFLCLGITVYFLSRHTIRIVFLRFCFITFHWQFSWFILFLYNGSKYADLICRIGYTGIIFLPVTVYDVMISYLGLSKKQIRWIYILCFGFLICLWTSDYFIKGAYKLSFGYYPEASFLHVGYVALIGVMMAMFCFQLYDIFRKEVDPIIRMQTRLFLIALIVFSLAAFDYVLNYPSLVAKIHIPVYPIGVFFIIFSMLIFVLTHFITLNLTLENRVALKTAQLEESVIALEEAAQIKKDFITNITHELRTPLTLIRGWTDYLREGQSGTISEPITEILGKISLQTLALMEKINELLKVSKFDAGMTKLILSKVDVSHYINQIVASFKELTEQSGIELRYLGSPDIGKIFIDQEKLKDILNNLIRNAYKFTEKGEIIVTLARGEDQLTIKVEDTGIGMSKEVLDKIFNRFQQGDSSLTRKYEGTGLGLAIVKDAVEMMQGRIEVASEPGKGTVFSIRLPMDLENRIPGAVIERRIADRRENPQSHLIDDDRHQQRRNADLAAISNKDIVKISFSEKSSSEKTGTKKIDSANSKGTIVIAEDNQGIQEFLMAALADYTLLVASNGELAWQSIQKTYPDLVISDIMMPKMDGYTLLEKIRSNEKTKNLPVIIITSLTEQDDRIRSLQLGADDYLTKPFHHIELQARVKNVLSVHKLEREKTKTEQLEVFLMVLASVIESKDEYTGGHVGRVAGYARDLAIKAGLEESLVHDIFLGTIVHDVGKIGIRDDVLNKPGKLTREEFEHIKTHPEIGKKLLAKLEIAPVAMNIAYCHQEKWNGKGYPQMLVELEIPVEARIAAIADVWDAITSDRPYRKAIPLKDAIQIMQEEKGQSLDPDLLDLFMDKTDKLYLKYLEKKPQALLKK